MATTFFDLIAVLLCPFVLSAAAWAIAINALAETDEISKVVEALIQPNGVEEIARRKVANRRRGNSSAIPSGDGGRLRVHLKRALRTAPNSTLAKRRAIKKALLRHDSRRAEGATIAGNQHDHELLTYASPVNAPAPLRTAFLLLFAAQLIAGAASPAHSGRFEFDQRRTEVRFVYKMAYLTQRGRFTKVSGTLDYDEAAPEKSKISALIAAASLTTGEALVDNELKGTAFFNVKASPMIAFKSLIVRPRSATAADVSGEITLNGITKPVTLKVSIEPHDDPALKYDAGAREFIATTRIQRSAFNMTDYQSMVDDDIDIEIAAIVRPR